MWFWDPDESRNQNVPVIRHTLIFTSNRPDVDFDVRLMRAVQVMDIPMLKDFINALVMDSLTYGKKFCPGSSIEESISSCYNHVCESRCKWTGLRFYFLIGQIEFVLRITLVCLEVGILFKCLILYHSTGWSWKNRGSTSWCWSWWTPQCS